MNEKEITSGIGNSAKQNESLQDYKAAQEAVERGDAKAIFRIYEKVLADRGACLKTIEILCETQPFPRQTATTSEIAMLKETVDRVLGLAEKIIDSFVERSGGGETR